MTAKPTIILAHPVLEAIIPVFREDYRVLTGWTPDGFAGRQQDVRAILVAGGAPLPASFMRNFPNVEVIGCIGTGIDGIDTAWCRAAGIRIIATPSLNAEDVADHAVLAALALYRRLPEGDRLIREGAWRDRGLLSPRLRGRVAGIIGFGAIGSAIASRAAAFGLEILWCGPRAKEGVSFRRVETILQLATLSDILFVACRADDDTAGLVAEAEIAALGPGGILCNISRGSVVDQDELLRALVDGRLGGAALDVFRDEPVSGAPWTDLPRSILTPHMAGTTREAVSEMLDHVRSALAAHFAATPIAAGAADPRR